MKAILFYSTNYGVNVHNEDRGKEKDVGVICFQNLYNDMIIHETGMVTLCQFIIDLF